MTEQQLDGAHVGAGFEQMGGERMTQRMGRDRFAYASTHASLLAHTTYRAAIDVLVGEPSRKEPVLRPTGLPISS